MPKYKERPTGPIGWLFLVALVGLLLWLIWSYPYLSVLVPVFILVDVWEKKKRNKHFNELLEGRENDSICTFSRQFEFREIDTWVIRAVYEQLQSYLNNENDSFPIKATDDVFKDLMIDDEDFEYDLVEEIAQRTGRTLENVESNPYYGKANVVENLVFFFNEQPKTNAA
ncbi:MAG: hypothetical protein AAF197_02665 [Pseudomonadota bacterium]